MIIFDEYPDKNKINRRISILQIIIIIVFSFFIISFWSIQIIHHSYYLEKAENNKLQIQELPAARGTIYDCNRIILADNSPAFNLLFNRSLSKEVSKSVSYMSELLSINKNELDNNLIQYASYSINRTIPLMEFLNIKQVSLIESRKFEHPEFSIKAIPQRYYPFGQIASHIIGYVGEASRNQIQIDIDLPIKMGQIIGQSGLEAYYDSIIRGINGEEYTIVNSAGVKVGEISSMKKEPISGKNIVISLDIKLQEFIANLYQDKKGTAIVMDPKTGELIALWSSPSFNSNHFIPKISIENWKLYSKAEDKPLINKATQGRYPPGSIFKLVVALAALNEHLITPQTQFFCPGYATIYGNTYHCWNPNGHGWMNLHSAITHSCNVYFFNVAKLLNIDTIAKYAKEFGFGKQTGIDLTNEIKGLIPDSQWKLKNTGKQWYAGETISVGVGQGPIFITPIQMATFMSFIANNGYAYSPHMLKKIVDNNGNEVNYQLKISVSSNINPKLIELIKEAMWSVVNAGGTATRASIPELDVCGKTGTIELITNKKLLQTNPELKEKFKEHSWFAGFAPKNNPELVVVVFVEHGGYGGQTAAPIAKEIFQFYFKKNIKTLIANKYYDRQKIN